MPTIVFIRHGKSNRRYDGLVDDIDRPLAKRGIDDAYRMAEALAKKGLHPQLLLASAAARTLQTASIFARQFGLSNVQLEPSLYLAPSEAYFTQLNLLGEEVDTVFVFGHNPTMSQMMYDYGDRSVFNIPTCGAQVYTFKGEWEDLLPAKMDYQYWIKPSDLRSTN